MRDFVRQVKRYYELGLWDEHRVREAVEKGAISTDEFNAITGKDLLGE